jgi:hypothetical protein
MKKLRIALAAVVKALDLNEPLLARARRRYAANRKRAFLAHEEQLSAHHKADRLRAKHHLAKAAREDRRAGQCSHRAYRNHLRAQFWLSRIRVLVQRIEELDTRKEHFEAELKKLDKVRIVGDTATGGTVPQRLKAIALKSAAACASGERANFYSQAGDYDVHHCITGPRFGHRDDCSSWKTSAHHSAGLKDPNGENYTAGYTETLRDYAVAHGLVVSRDKLKPGGSVIYGPPGATHHVEMYVGPGEKTIGHGSAPVDAGIVNLFGPDEYMTFCNYHD